MFALLYFRVEQPGAEPVVLESQVQRPNHYSSRLHYK